jgi:hypothetical protein
VRVAQNAFTRALAARNDALPHEIQQHLEVYQRRLQGADTAEPSDPEYS